MTTSSDITPVLSDKIKDELESQINRSAVALSLIRKESGLGGAQCLWDVAFSGKSAKAVAEGADVESGEFDSDVFKKAGLGWATYRTALSLTEREIDVAFSASTSPKQLQDIFNTRLVMAVDKLVSTINADLFVGDGYNSDDDPTIIGLLGGALEASGTYAGIDRGTYAEWKGNVLANGGTPRALTVDLMQQMVDNIHVASNSMPNLIIASHSDARKYKQLFETNRRIINEGKYSIGGADDMGFAGAVIVRDKDLSQGKMLFLDTRKVVLYQLPHKEVDGGMVFSASGLNFKLGKLAKSGPTVKAWVETTVCLAVEKPNACGYVADLSA